MDRTARFERAIKIAREGKLRIKPSTILKALGETDVEKSIREFMEKQLKKNG